MRETAQLVIRQELTAGMVKLINVNPHQKPYASPDAQRMQFLTNTAQPEDCLKVQYAIAAALA